MKLTAGVTAGVALIAGLLVVGAQSQRLPGESLPHAYTVSITPYLVEGNSSFTFYGYTSIWVEVLTNTSVLTMHSDVTVLLVSVFRPDGYVIGATGNPHMDGSNFLDILMMEEAAAGDYLQVNIEFIGTMNEDLFGFYRSSYEEDGETKWLGVTQFERDGARMAMPCYDEPAIKATFDFTFRPLQGYDVLFNTPQINATDDWDGRRTIWFERTPVMSAFLLAWVVSDLVGVESALEPNTTVWTSRDTAAQAQYAGRVAPLTVSAMEQLVGVPYNHGNLSKMDHAAIPDFSAGAMENWGLITYRQVYLLALDNVTSEADKQQVLTVIQHEVSHQWFGDLVSPNWWSVLWLSEGFATFFETFGSAVVEPTWRLDEVFVVSTLLYPAMVYDEDASAPPITSEDADINIYYKGGSIIRMMQNFIGDDAFYNGLHNYLTENQFSNATDDILFGAMDAVAASSSLPEGASVSDVMLPWARQSGFPILTVTRNYEDGSATITQSRWLVPVDPDDQTMWTVPVTYTSSGEADFSTSTKLWLAERSVTLDSVAGASADQWVLFNLQVAGFYRVQYDSENWRLLTEQLLASPDAIPPVNRAALLDDAMALVQADQLPVDTLLSLASYLASELDYIPWLESDRLFQYLYSIMDADEYNELVLSAVAAVTAELGFEARPGDSHVTRVLRGVVAAHACDSGQTACREDAYSQFQRYAADPASWVDPDMKPVVYCEGVRQGGDSALSFLLQQLNSTSVISEQSVIVGALVCQATRASVRNLLEDAALASVEGLQWGKYLPRLLEAALSKTRVEAASAALEFLADNPEVLLESNIDYKTLRKLLTKFIRVVCDENLLQKVHLVASSIADSALTSAVNSRRAGMDRCDTLRQEASRWLQDSKISRMVE